ncbi:sigma-70 family RNA polymerase sigma factor [Candidatus Daviesbacteria bacterium]|nr:sigma-70 family RNA polymerase sigma factor [Candidatus Daviesbacteria bacterium]
MSLVHERLYPPRLAAYIADAVSSTKLSPLRILPTIFDIKAPELKNTILLARKRRGYTPYGLLSFVAAASSNDEGDYYYPTIDDIVRDFHGSLIETYNNQRLVRSSRTTNGSNILKGIMDGYEKLKLDDLNPSDLPEDVALLRAWFLGDHVDHKNGIEKLTLTSLLRKIPAEELHSQSLNGFDQENDDLELAEDEPNSEELQALEREFSLSNLPEDDPGDIAALYLRDASQAPLLTAEQEVALAKTIEIGETARIQLAGAGLDQSQNMQLAEYVNLSDEARRRLTESNLRLVISVARKYLGRGFEFLDLVQEGNIGLRRAVEKYDWRRGYRFSTYAYWWIRQAATRAIAEKSRTIRIPVHMVEAIGKLGGAESQLRGALGRNPTNQELAKALDTTLEQITKIRAAKKQTVSLDAPIKEQDDLTWADLLADRNAPTVVELVTKRRLRDELADVLDSLTPRQRAVIRLRYGLIDGRERTLGEVGEELGVSRERVRQIESEAFTALRLPAQACKLREYID